MFFNKKSSPIQGETVEVRFGNSAVFEFDNLLDRHPYLDTEANKRLIKAARTAFGISINKVFKSIVDQVDLAREESDDSYWDENNVIQLQLDYENEERPVIVTFEPTKERTIRVSVDSILPSLKESTSRLENLLEQHDLVNQEIEETITRAEFFLENSDEPEAPSAAIARK